MFVFYTQVYNTLLDKKGTSLNNNLFMYKYINTQVHKIEISNNNDI